MFSSTITRFSARKRTHHFENDASESKRDQSFSKIVDLNLKTFFSSHLSVFLTNLLRSWRFQISVIFRRAYEHFCPLFVHFIVTRIVLFRQIKCRFQCPRKKKKKKGKHEPCIVFSMQCVSGPTRSFVPLPPASGKGLTVKKRYSCRGLYVRRKDLEMVTLTQFGDK